MFICLRNRKMNWKKLLSKKRLPLLPQNMFNDPIDKRHEWQRDQDRIIFSGAFRRLALKTQVHPFSENDHVRTRLSHSLEVASVGRSLGNRIGKFLSNKGTLPKTINPNEIGTLVQASCLAHDIGNPPFGHSGEHAIRKFFVLRPEIMIGLTNAEKADLLGFEGNAQGFRLLTSIERFGGMQLTASTLGTYVKYPFLATHPASIPLKKHGVNIREWPIMEKIAKELGLIAKASTGFARHPLVFLMEAADDICYSLTDLEDAVKLGKLSYESVSMLMKEMVEFGESKKSYKHLLKNPLTQLEFLRSAAIDALVLESEKRFKLNYDSIMEGCFEEDLLDWRKASAGEIMHKAKSIARERIYSKSSNLMITSFDNSERVFEIVLNHFVGAVEEYRNANFDGTKISACARDGIDRLGRFRPQKNTSCYDAFMQIIDCVSGMTDRFILKTIDELSFLNYCDSTFTSQFKT